MCQLGEAGLLRDCFHLSDIERECLISGAWHDMVANERLRRLTITFDHATPEALVGDHDVRPCRVADVKALNGG